MRNIIKVLLNEGLEREDVVAICKYIKETYTEDELKGLTSTNKRDLLNTMAGYEEGQTKLISKDDALKNAQLRSNQEIEKKNALKQGKKEFEKNHPKQEQPQAEVKQRSIFDQLNGN